MNSFAEEESSFDSTIDNVSAASSHSKPFVEKPLRTFRCRSLIIGVVVVIIVLAGAGSGIYYYAKYQTVQKILGDSTKSLDKTSELIQKVRSLVELPRDENPTIATVTDTTKLKGQSFFAHAKNGDKVLIYQKAKKAILYDPASSKIIEVQAINISSAEQNIASPPASVSQPVRVVLLNGTKIIGYASATEKSLTSVSATLKVVSKGDAQANYIKTLIVDLDGKNATSAFKLASILNAEISALPAGEVRPTNADILVILGKN